MQEFQSAPAIAGGRIKGECANTLDVRLFQSAPAIAGGRIRLTEGDGVQLLEFQSAPAIAGGRIANILSCLLRQVSFNPRPPLLAGESGCSTACWTRPWGFNPRPPLLAGESGAQAAGTVGLLFQSAPAIAGGRIARPHWPACAWRVSIRARHCWRANRVVLALTGGLIDVSIRARHCWRANRVSHSAAVKDLLFQSAPAIAGGRIQAKPVRL